MLKAIPTALRDELVSKQRMTSIDVVALVCNTYQPGGLCERSALLRFLTSPENATDVASALKQVKRWSQWRRRAGQLTVAVPDPTLLLAGLDGLTSKVLSKYPEVSFKLQSFRYSQNTDVAPTLAKICDLADMLQAELEALDSGISKTTKAAKAETTSDPPEGKGNGNKSKYKHWLTAGGCHYGRACTFARSALGKGDKRCFNCSPTEHYKESCPYPQRAPAGDADKGKSKGKKGSKKGAGEGSKSSSVSELAASMGTSAPNQASPAGPDQKVVSEEARQDTFKEVTAAIKQLTAVSSNNASAKMRRCILC